MSMTDPYLTKGANAVPGTGQRGKHVASKGAGGKGQSSSTVYDGAQSSGSAAAAHGSASGFAPKGTLNKGAPESSGASPVNVPEPHIQPRVNAPSGTTREGGIPVPLD